MLTKVLVKELMQVKRHEMSWFAIMLELFAPVAQLDRVLVSEAKGRGFDSRRAHHCLLIPRGSTH